MGMTPEEEAIDHAPATSTREQDRHALGQRRVNIIWEMTQAFIAIGVVSALLYTSAKIALRNDMDKTAFIVMSDIGSLVIGFYFGRTNHQKVGGVDLGR